MVEYWFVRPNVVGSSPINPVTGICCNVNTGGSSIGRVFALGADGYRFESYSPDLVNTYIYQK